MSAGNSIAITRNPSGGFDISYVHTDGDTTHVGCFPTLKEAIAQRPAVATARIKPSFVARPGGRP